MTSLSGGESMICVIIFENNCKCFMHSVYRKAVRRSSIKHSKIIVKVLYGFIVLIFIYTVVGPIYCALNEVISESFYGLKDVGKVLCR